MTSSQPLKVIDWDLGIQLAGGDEVLAQEMFNLLIKELPETSQLIEQAFNSQDNNELQRIVHKLHGGTCYCGVPRLKAAAAKLDDALKKAEFPHTEDLTQQLQYEIKRVIEDIGN